MSVSTNARANLENCGFGLSKCQQPGRMSGALHQCRLQVSRLDPGHGSWGGILGLFPCEVNRSDQMSTSLSSWEHNKLTAQFLLLVSDDLIHFSSTLALI